MGIALFVPGVDFSDTNLGQVTLSGDTPIEGISINSPSSFTGEVLQLQIDYNPIFTTERDIVWSIESGSEYGYVDSNGKLYIATSASGSTVTVKATSVDDSSIFATKEIEVTYEDASGLVWQNITEDMVVAGYTITSQNGIISPTSATQAPKRKVALIPIPNGATKLYIKTDIANDNDIVSFISQDSLPAEDTNPTHFSVYQAVPYVKDEFNIQNNDKSAVVWAKINDSITAVGHKQFAFT